VVSRVSIQVAVAVAALDRERQADPAGATGEQAVREAEVRVGLGEHERRAAHDRGEADGAGDVAAAAEDDIGAMAAQQPSGRAERTDGFRRRPGGLERIAPRDPLDVQRVELVAGGRHELLLGALAAGEADVRAFSP
jgi:hypothetical protein